MRVQNVTYPDVNNGLGCRVTLWVSGCNQHCKGCHNVQAWSFLSGKVFNTDYFNKLMSIINLPYIKGLTLSGGDPLDSVDDVLNLVKRVRDYFGNTKDIWLYTGHTFETLNDKELELVSLCDVLVDGPFIEDLKDITLPFRGSSNQRIIDVRKTLEENKIILYEMRS